MLHPWPQVTGYVEDTVDGARGPMTVIWSKQFYETDLSRGFVRGYTLQFARGTGPVTEAIDGVAAGRLPWGSEHHHIFRQLLDHRLRIGVACEDLPEEHNRVTLDPELKDSHGIPAPRIEYRDQREHAADDGAWHCPGGGNPRRGRCQANFVHPAPC